MQRATRGLVAETLLELVNEHGRMAALIALEAVGAKRATDMTPAQTIKFVQIVSRALARYEKDKPK